MKRRTTLRFESDTAMTVEEIARVAASLANENVVVGGIGELRTMGQDGRVHKMELSFVEEVEL